MAYECPKNRDVIHSNIVVAPVEEGELKVQEAENVPDIAESLLLKKVLLKPKKEVVELAKMKALFMNIFKVSGKCCKMVIDSGNTDNLVPIEVVEKLSLKRMKHPTLYKVPWLQRDHKLLVNEECEVEL